MTVRSGCTGSCEMTLMGTAVIGLLFQSNGEDCANQTGKTYCCCCCYHSLMVMTIIVIVPIKTGKTKKTSCVFIRAKGPVVCCCVLFTQHLHQQQGSY